MWHRKVAAKTVNSIHQFTGGNRKCLAKYVKQEFYIAMFLQHATGNTCRDH
jgi:hypothetical protein